MPIPDADGDATEAPQEANAGAHMFLVRWVFFEGFNK